MVYSVGIKGSGELPFSCLFLLLLLFLQPCFAPVWSSTLLQLQPEQMMNSLEEKCSVACDVLKPLHVAPVMARGGSQNIWDTNLSSLLHFPFISNIHIC